MALPRFVHLTSELRTFVSAAWRGFRAFTTALRAPALESAKVSTAVEKESALPHSYERTRLVVLPIDPYTAYAYWQITPGTLDQSAGRIQEDISELRPVLRFEDASPERGSVRDRLLFDIEIKLEALNWYIPLWSPGQSYDVTLGFKARGGKFFPLTGTAGLQTPRAWPEPKVEEQFVRISGEERQAELAEPPEHRKPAPLEPAAFQDPVIRENSVTFHSPALRQGTAMTQMPPIPLLSSPLFPDFSERHDDIRDLRMPPHIARRVYPTAEEVPTDAALIWASDLTEVAERHFVPGISSAVSREGER